MIEESYADKLQKLTQANFPVDYPVPFKVEDALTHCGVRHNTRMNALRLMFPFFDFEAGI